MSYDLYDWTSIDAWGIPHGRVSVWVCYCGHMQNWYQSRYCRAREGHTGQHCGLVMEKVYPYA